MAGDPLVLTPVRFGPFELFVETGELRRDGVRLKLSGQPIQVLRTLVASAGKLVTREELQHQLWSGSSFGDFEKGLNAAVNRLRENLHDSAHDPKYIETIPGRGYRFIHPVEPTEKHTSDTSSPAVQPKTGNHRRLWIALSSFAAILLGLGTVLLLRSHRVSALTEKDSVVLADFANTTGDAVFTDTLRQGLLVQLNQSPFLDILSDDKVRTTLRQMGHQPEDILNDQLAREVCERNQSKAFIAGSIASLGSQYVLGLKAVNCKTGDVLVQEQSQVARKEEVLESLGKQSLLLRRRLGESLSSVEKFDIPLEQATTPSLEALQAYTLGRKQSLQMNFPSASRFFQRAIELDPNFAMAYARLGSVYANLEKSEPAEENYARAFSLRQRVTDRERLHIAAVYYMQKGEDEKATQAFEVLTNTYPRDASSYIGLTRIYGLSGQLNKSLEAAREAYRLEPTPVTASNLEKSYQDLGRVQDAEQFLAEAEKRFPGNDEFFGWWWSYRLAFLRDDRIEMKRLLKAAPTGSQDINIAQCSTEAYYGHLKNARDSCRRAVNSERANEGDESASLILTRLANVEAYFGNSSDARQLAAESLSLVKTKDVMESAALAYANSGDIRQAQALADKLAQAYASDRLLNIRELPMVRASIEIKRNNPSEAIQILEKASPVELGNLNVAYIRGQAHLLSHRGSEAAAEFQKIFDHPGVNEDRVIGALAHLGMARARALEGDAAKTRAEYERFLDLWKDADPDIPIYQQAKAEYPKLQ